MARKGNGTRARSTISGRFVTKVHAKRSPRTTVNEKVGGGSTHGAIRSAVSGKFVGTGYGARNPRTTMRDG